MKRILIASLLVVAGGVSVLAWQIRGNPNRTNITRTTPLFKCGDDADVLMAPPVNWFTIALAADNRLYSPCPATSHLERHREMRDAKLLADASGNTIPEIRRLAIAAYGRLGRPEFVGIPSAPGVLMLALQDQYPPIRREAISAIADALSGVAVEPDDTGPHPPQPGQIEYARSTFERLLISERDNDVAAMIFETLGRLKYADEFSRESVESLLVSNATGGPVRLLGVAKGLESLTRANARRPIQPQTRDLLRMLATTGPTTETVPTIAGAGSAEAPGEKATFARIRRLAMQSLATVRDDDMLTVMKAATDADWQVRRLAAMRVDLERTETAGTWQALTLDRAFQVRYEVVTIEGRRAIRTHDCAALVKAIDDPVLIVATHAMDVLPKDCEDPGGEIVQKLGTVAAEVGRSGITGWHKPTRAIMALQRINGGGSSQVSNMLFHQAWQVRAAAATILGEVGDFRKLRPLARDRDFNVRTAALQALIKDKSDETIDLEIQALGATDHQLVMTAANAMKGTPEPRRNEVVNALFLNFDRLTKIAADTSRDPRLAIIQRLEELMPKEWADRLSAMTDDFDPRVRLAAATAYRNLIGAPLPGWPPAQHRYPLQPVAEDMPTLPTRALIAMPGIGTIEIELLTTQAPVTVARFVELVKARYYDGLTFHRVVPNFVIQGGSPNANEYSGLSERYWRDEVGTEPHTRGAVGISSRGHDTGDGQIFIDLVDLPRLDHDYTVFARVVSGLDALDKVVEGSRIQAITLK